MIPNDLNPNTFYRSYNDYAQVYAGARSLQGAVAAKAIGALRRRIAAAISDRRQRHGQDHGNRVSPSAA